MLRYFLQSLLLLISANAVMAGENLPDMFSNGGASSPNTRFTAPKAMMKLPITGLVMIEDDSGITFVSDNGHFIIRGGELFDMWTKKPVLDVEGLKVATRINFESMGLDINEFKPFTYGTGPEQVIVFIDPKCGSCHQLLKELPALANDYTFKIILTPIISKASYPISAKLTCMRDEVQAYQILTSRNWRLLDDIRTEECSNLHLEKAKITAKVLGMKGVPFVVASNGVPRTGAGNLGAFLRKNGS